MSVAQLAAGRARPRAFTRVVSLGPVTVGAGVVAAGFILLALVGPLLAPHDPTQIDTVSVFAGSSASHPLGTDDTGRDILSRLMHGARVSLAGPALVILAATTIGAVVALLAAWFGGWFDATIARVLEVIFAFPGLILAIVVATIFGVGFLSPIVALTIAYVPVIARVLRTAAIKERNLPYVAALRVQGASGWSICLRHVVPNLMPLIVVQAAVGFGYAMLDVAAISYLGLGVQPPSPDWGVMVAEGQRAIAAGHPQQSLYAGLTIVLAVVSFNLLGEGLAQRLEAATP